MSAGHSAPRHYTPSPSDSLTFYKAEGEKCQPATQHSVAVEFTYDLQYRRRAVIDGHSAPRYHTPSLLNSLTIYRTEGGQC